MLEGLKERQEYDYYASLYASSRATSKDYLISVFDEMSSFVYSPHGSWEGHSIDNLSLYHVDMSSLISHYNHYIDCGGILFPEHALNRPVGKPSIASKVRTLSPSSFIELYRQIS